MDYMEHLHNYVESTTKDFNEQIFTRSDMQIVDSLQKIILSCQRDSHVKIKVLKFTLLTDYKEVMDRLSAYEEYVISRPSSKQKGQLDNRYAHIDMRESDLNLLVVRYYIEAKNDKKNSPDPRRSEEIEVLIAIPKVVDKFYFRLNGGIYSAMYQLVDASTYNMTTVKSTKTVKHSITLRSMFQAIRIFRNFYTLTTVEGDTVKCCTYDNNTFSKSIPVSLYFFAKFGLYETLKFLGLYGAIYFSTEPAKSEAFYTFLPANNSNIFINVAKVLFDKNQVLQHVVYTLYLHIKKEFTYEDIFEPNDIWKTVLGLAFNNQTDPHNKGINILLSLELIYDLETKQELHLPEEYKHDIYCVLRWIIWEYNNLRIKDNSNILTKKLRCSEYIASIYAAKLSRSIYWLSDKGKNADIAAIKKVLLTHPLYIINEMCSDKLINFRGMVTDMDSLLAMKFTYKGSFGINIISNTYKLLHVSHLGVLDLDASSPSDPGVSGSIAPYAKLYDGAYFSKFQEPMTWEKEYATLYNSYKNTRGLQEIMNLEEKVLDLKKHSAEEMIIAEENAEAARRLVTVATKAESNIESYEGLPLEGSGRIQYE